MQKMSRTELHGLLGPAVAGTGAPVAPVPPALPVGAAAAPAAASQPKAPSQQGLVPEQRMLMEALPRLWEKARQTQGLPAGAAQYHKLRELMAWWCEKHGYAMRHRYALEYHDGGVPRQGRLDALVTDAAGAPRLGVEVDWTLTPASIQKLHALSLQRVPVLWVVGAALPAAGGARAFADRVAGQPTGRWLPIVELGCPATR